ncbi:phage tail protein [Sedimentibacter hydroxybenzoicus DSM 7310]|uniref:Phage tail protein n=1 Tax=Sedimentibacter hydroxybenzoicus DSM 7310 TaxID=1123245 RepID=A0A974GVX5_SEDHY|nr:major tail protein [Sedimentibacter hydroxybenzoicus]NYB73854.1 phage tail protein [Sedimentibacter hydroxybenzoicus DSM 7310]
MPKVGLEKLYYAILTKDDKTGLTYEAPVYLPGVKEITVNPTTQTAKLFAENKLWDQDTALDEVQIGINLADVSNKDSAIMLGQTVAAEGGVFANEADEPPYLALLYKANKSNKQARYQVLYKGKLSLPQENNKTKEGQTEYQTPQMSGIFQPTINDGNWKYQVDTDDPDCPTDIETAFFENVIIPTKKVTEP